MVNNLLQKNLCLFFLCIGELLGSLMESSLIKIHFALLTRRILAIFSSMDKDFFSNCRRRSLALFIQLSAWSIVGFEVGLGSVNTPYSATLSWTPAWISLFAKSKTADCLPVQVSIAKRIPVSSGKGEFIIIKSKALRNRKLV